MFIKKIIDEIQKFKSGSYKVRQAEDEDKNKKNKKDKCTIL